MKKLCFVATIPAVIHSFLHEHIRASAQQWQVAIVSRGEGAELLQGLDAEFIPLAVERKISPWRDLLALVRLVAIFRSERFDLVHTIMPKTALLGMLAAWLARVPYRIHTFTGQVWATRTGWKRAMLKMFDRLIALLATQVLVDSPSQRDFLIAEGVLPAGKGLVMGQGSICGVDVQRFHPDAQIAAEMREQLQIAATDTVILFLGRLNRDKGMLDLAAAFREIAARRGDVVLVLVGAEEDVSFEQIQDICGEYRQRLRRVDFTSRPERYMAMADVFCLPSYREGFGQVIIEAGASGVPTVASRIYGVTDAVDDGNTGLLFPAGDVAALARALLVLIEDKALREAMGNAARQRAVTLFTSEIITHEMQHFYRQLLGEQ